MQRVTVSIEDSLGETFDRMIASRHYASRSEAVRDLVRSAVERWRSEEGGEGYCVANLSYVFDRTVHHLPDHLAALEHEHHDLVASSTSMRLDHRDSLVATMLKGHSPRVRTFIDTIAALRGVRLPRVNIVAVRPHDHHDAPGSHSHHGHDHLTPLV